MDELDQLFLRVSRYFGLLSEPTRLKILHTLCDGERPVTDIVAAIGSTQANISRHLNTMYRSEVLARRKDGNMVYYRIEDDVCVALCKVVCNQVAGSMGDEPRQRRLTEEFMPLEEAVDE